MIIFVDYDNLLSHQRQRGVRFIVERTISRVAGVVSLIPDRVRVRLYGGWYDGATLSRKAQVLSRQLLDDFPSTVAVGADGSSRSVLVTAELALALEIEPSSHLHHTYRKQNPPAGVKCHDPRVLGCNHEDCPTVLIHQFFARGGCTREGCTLTVRDLLFRAGQKLVDTMLTADLIHEALSGRQLIVLSSDDDLWPGMRSALAIGAQTIQVHTHAGFSNRDIYSPTTGRPYQVLEFD